MTTYRAFVQKYINPSISHKDYLLNSSMGLAGEAGEFIDAVKKHLFQGHPLDSSKLVNELGDILFYAELAAIALNIDTKTVIQRNMHKLRTRYPDGFTEEKSQHRRQPDER